MKNISVIYEALLNWKEKVIRKQEIAETIKSFNKKFGASLNTENTLKYLTRHDYIKRIFLGYYYINSFDERKRNFCMYEDKELLFSVLNKLGIRWYAGLSYALYLSGKSWQSPTVLSIINNKFSGKRNILGIKIKFYKIKANLIFGLKKLRTKNNIVYAYSVPSKTCLDSVYLGISQKLIKSKETRAYLKRYPKWVGKR